MSTADAPYPGTYWVTPGTLLAGAFPAGSDEATTDQRLEALLDAGIRSVINLMDDEEETGLAGETHYVAYEDRLEALGEERGVIIEIVRYAIDDGSTPSDQELEMILDAIDAEIDGRNSPTLVHCSTGHGRTALVVGCYLARHEIAVGNKVVDHIHKLRGIYPDLANHKSPENIVHERLISRWKPQQ